MATGIHILVQAETQMSAVGASLRVLWLAAVFGLGSCLLGSLLLSASAGQPPVQEQVLSTPADTPVPIPVPEIAERAGEVATLLRQTREAQAPGPILQTISDELPPVSEWIRDRFAATAEALDASVSPIALATLADSWRVRRSQLVTWNGVLTQQGMQLERARQQLEAVHAIWTISRQQAVASRAPAPVPKRVALAPAVHAALRAARSCGSDEAGGKIAGTTPADRNPPAPFERRGGGFGGHRGQGNPIHNFQSQPLGARDLCGARRRPKEGSRWKRLQCWRWSSGAC